MSRRLFDPTRLAVFGFVAGLALTGVTAHADSASKATTDWVVQTLELPGRFVDTSPIEIQESILFVPTSNGIGLFRKTGGTWSRCGRIGTPMGEGEHGALMNGPDGAASVNVTGLSLSGDTLAIINLRPEIGDSYSLRERLDVLTRRGDSCDFVWSGESLWAAPRDGPPVFGKAALEVFGSRIAVGDPGSQMVQVFERAPDGSWVTQTELHPRTRSGPLPVSHGRQFGGFGDGVSILRRESGETELAISAPNDEESIPASGTVYLFAESGDGSGFAPSGKLYAPDSRPGDSFGADLAVSARWLRSFNRLFERTADGRLVEIPGSPLTPANVSKNGSVVAAAWSDDLAVLGAPTRFDRNESKEYFAANPGHIYVFERTEAGWQEILPPPPTPAGAFHEFGRSVAISGREIFVSDPEAHRVYVMERPESE